MSEPGNVVPPKLMEDLVESHGRDTNQWNQELRDLFDPSIEARPLNPPLSGLIEFRKNTSFEYRWIKDICGANPNHERVESLRPLGWDFATTDDVVMKNEFTVKNRKGGKKDGWSNEIRNGDLRLMKLPMPLWRAKRKAENVAAFQMAYPQAFGATGKPMRAQDLVHEKVRTSFISPSKLEEMQASSNPGNTSTLTVPKGDE